MGDELISSFNNSIQFKPCCEIYSFILLHNLFYQRASVNVPDLYLPLFAEEVSNYKFQNPDKMKFITNLIFLLLFGLLSCNQADKKESTPPVQANNFINPPITGVNVPYTEYSVNAAKGDTIFYESGSIILFPPNSFVDKEGNPIQGDVDVKYREFSTPIDFYLAGIPMNYDSAGKTYVFESSGMCEVLAYKNGVPVFVNPKNKPEIHMVSNSNSQSHNIYYLDTVQKKWVYKDRSIVTEPGNIKNENQISPSADIGLEEPLNPEKANTKSPLIKIAIEPGSFKELLVYDNMQFQLEPNEIKFNPNDSNEEWSDVELIKGKTKGLYTIKFSNAKKTVSYSARPVLEGKDYDKALKVFEKNNIAYKRKLNERNSQEKARKEEYLKDSVENQKFLVENERIKKLNILIEARNKEIEKQNVLIEEKNNSIRESNLSTSVIRSLKIDGFGYWNCDFAKFVKLQSITATFKDNKGNLLELTYVVVVYKSLNGIIRFPDNKIQVAKDADNMVFGIYNGKFAYLTYDDYNKLNITAKTKEQTFIMTIASDENNNSDFIKKIGGR